MDRNIYPNNDILCKSKLTKEYQYCQKNFTKQFKIKSKGEYGDNVVQIVLNRLKIDSFDHFGRKNNTYSAYVFNKFYPVMLSH